MPVLVRQVSAYRLLSMTQSISRHQAARTIGTRFEEEVFRGCAPHSRQAASQSEQLTFMEMSPFCPHGSTVHPLAEKLLEGHQEVIGALSSVRMHAEYIRALLSFRRFPSNKPNEKSRRADSNRFPAPATS